jgi:hypothetical protein
MPVRSRRLRPIAVAAALLAIAAPALVAGPASAATDRSALDVDVDAPFIIAFHNRGTWTFTATNTGTGPTLTPVTLAVKYNEGSNPYIPGTPNAWSHVTVSSPQTKQCSIDTTKKIATCIAPPLAPGKTATITVSARADLAATRDAVINWRVAAARGAKDPDVLYDTRISATTQRALRGAFDSATTTAHGIAVRGWAADPQNSGDHFAIAVTSNGTRAGQLGIGAARPDVTKVYGFPSDSGFAGVVPAVGSGTQRVCATAVHVQTSGVLDLGCRTVDPGPGMPQGRLDRVTTGPDAFTVAGWAYDPDAIGAATRLSVTARGPADDQAKVVGTVSADQPRPDVNAVKGVTGDHGYSVTFSPRQTQVYGPETICVVATNVAAGSDTILGCKSLDIPLDNG